MSGGSGVDPYYQKDPPKKETKKTAAGTRGFQPGTKSPRTWDVKEAYRLYTEERMSTTEVAKATGVAPSTIWQAFKDNNLRMRKSARPSVEDVRRLYFDKGLSQQQVARELGVGLRTISRAFQEHGLEARTRNYTDQDVKDAYDKGLSLKEAGAQFGISERRVIQIFQRNGWAARPLRKTPIDKTLELIRRGYTQEECAEELGVSSGAVWQVLNKFGMTATRRTDERIRKAQALARQYEKSKDWKRTRDRIRTRDNDTCQDCGAGPGEGRGVGLGVHHTKPLVEWILEGHDPPDYPDDLLKTLCGSCHSKAEVRWKRKDLPAWRQSGDDCE